MKELTNRLIKFRDQRDWAQFHTLKDLAISIAIEAGELLEEFQWKDLKAQREHIEGPGKKRVASEVADIMIYLLLFCHEAGIDLLKAVKEKIEEHERKYPVEKAKGTAKKYTEL
ncbi:MAG: nucleotide pyrophosphohydrolase [Nitrospirae bacterium]|nr:MAG: nucleotide pyrophosphohydrolase [Nitrospirota bacterium]